jgi:hypothetical protein
MIALALAGYARFEVRRDFVARSQTIGASEIGRCARQLFYLKNEGDPVHGACRNPDFVEGWGNPVRGTVFEESFWTPALSAAYGDRLRFAGKDQETFVKGFLSATPDGLLIDLADDALAPLGVASLGGDRSLVVECKSVHPNTRLTEPKLAHVYQVQVGLGLIRELTEHRPEYALISYTNASDWSETREFVVERDPAIFDVAQRRALQILTAMFAEALPPEGLTSGGRECEWCPYSNACLSAEALDLNRKPANVGA